MKFEPLNRLKPGHSLKNTLTLWFILFALVPLIMIVAYSSWMFHHHIQSEQGKRLQAFEKGIELELGDIEEKLRLSSFRHATDTAILDPFRRNQLTRLENISLNLVENFITDRISYFSAQGDHRLSVTAQRITQNPEFLLPDELNTLPSTLHQLIQDQKQLLSKTTHKGIGYTLDSYTLMQSGRRSIGILKETLVIDRFYLQQTKERTGLDLIVFDQNFKLQASTLSPQQETQLQNTKPAARFSSIDLLDESYRMLTKPLTDEREQKIGYLAIIVSSTQTQAALFEILGLFILISLLLTVIVVFFTKFAAKTVLDPLHEMVDATQDISQGKWGETIEVPQMQEFKQLITSFNHMSTSLEKIRKERENAQAQLVQSSRMVSLGQLVAGIAHELNNPIGYTHSNITHLKGYVENLKSMIQTYRKFCKKLSQKESGELKNTEKELDVSYILKDIDQLIESSLDGTQRTKDIVTGLRNFSRVDEAEIKTVDLHEGLESTLKILSSEFKDKITLHKNFEKLEPLTCYPSQLNQVFMNLLTNAIHAIEQKGDIWITTLENQKNIEIQIRDNGKGIPKKDLNRIFDPFFTTKKVGQGTGLGLSISYGIIQKHGGKIEVQSTPEQGTTFTLTLPKAGISQ